MSGNSSGSSSSSSSSSMKLTNLMMAVLTIFSVTLVGMNMVYLPSLGFLSGPTGQYQAALAEFTANYNSGGSYTGPGRYTSYQYEKPDVVAKKEKENGASKKNNKKNSNNKNENEDLTPHEKAKIRFTKTKAKKESTAKQLEEDRKQLEEDRNAIQEAHKRADEEEEAKAKAKEKAADNNNNSNNDEKKNIEDAATQHPRIAGLNCDKYGGPSEEIASEMVYWRDIPNDAHYASPFASNSDDGETKYLTFEPDEGGFNNIRMSMETATALAHAMGRTLVLPPEQNMYLLDKGDQAHHNRWTFKKFFPFDAISEEHKAVDVITMEEFLEREVMTGKLKDRNGTSVFPPGNETNFQGHIRDGRKYWDWMRTVTTKSTADFSKCVMAFPEKPGKESADDMRKIYESLDKRKQNHNVHNKYADNPQPIIAPVKDRLHETLSFRSKICLYDEEKQNAKVMHFMGNNDSGARLLVHFYAFLFFADWKQDLWTKRYVRDHLRYIDTIQCAAASIVHSVRQKAIENGNKEGHYDSMHIRRGDFQYKRTRIPAEEIYENIKDIFTENATVFIATDERNSTFFDPLRKHYQLYFLDDFLHLLPEGFNKNYFGMLDQRVASRGRVFAGAYFSTFTGYINRMRGYHSQKDKADGYLQGRLKSHFYVPRDKRDEMSVYQSLLGPLWGREFPTAWRDIDHDLEEAHIVAR